MIPALARFLDALRAESVAVSAAEAIDAARALDLVGLERREVVRHALAATLAKDTRTRATFDRLFDAFFSTPKIPSSGRGEGRPASAGEGRTSRRPPADDEERRRGRATRREEKGRKAEGRSSADPRPASSLRRGRLLKVVRRERSVQMLPPATHRPLARRMTTDEERRLAAEVPRLLEALRLKPGRRREEARTGRPWLRQALRRATATQGVPFVIPMRRPRPRRTRVVLLVDVSYSVARAAGFFLLMAGAFLAYGRRARVLAFVDRPVDVTDAIARWVRGGALKGPGRRSGRPGEGILRGGVSFAEVLGGIEELNLEAPSDYGRALHALRSLRVGLRGRDTLLVVLGDARSNRFDPLPWSFEDLARGCGGVLWLVPEPASRWGTGDSRLDDYLPSIDVLVEANDLAGLAAGVDALRRRL